MTTARNLPSTITSFPAPTPQLSQSLSPAELETHRTQIAFDVEVVLSGYWQADLEPKMKAAVMADWADELEDWTLEQVRWGLRAWRRDNPRRKPNPGDILGILKTQRGKTEAAKLAALPRPQPAPRAPVTGEAAAEILARAGFAPRRVGGAE